MRGLERTIDFTRGSPLRNLVLFSLPILMGELLQNLYNSVDALIVGNFVGDNALAAVTVCGYIAQLMIGFFNGMGVGINVVVSRAFGAGDVPKLKRTIRISFTFSLLLGVVLSTAGIVLAPSLLRLTATREEFYGEALTYLRIYLAGIMFTVIYNSGAGILRAVGDSGTPFRILCAACAVNIVLDVLLVKFLSLGVAGAGLATVISQFLSVACVYASINRSQQTHCIDLPEMKREGKQTVLSILDIGVAAGMQSALISISNLFVARYINRFDTASVAGIGIAQRVDKFIALPTKSFGVTMTTYVSQNLGAGQYGRVRKGFLECLLFSLALTASLSMLLYLLREPCSALFNSNPEVIAVGAAALQVFTPFFVFMAVREILLGLLRGCGRSRTPMVLSLIGMVGLRQVFLMVAMGRNEDIRNIYWCYPIAWAATAALLLAYFLLVRKHMTGLSGEQQPEESCRPEI